MKFWKIGNHYVVPQHDDLVCPSCGHVCECPHSDAGDVCYCGAEYVYLNDLAKVQHLRRRAGVLQSLACFPLDSVRIDPAMRRARVELEWTCLWFNILPAPRRNAHGMETWLEFDRFEHHPKLLPTLCLQKLGISTKKEVDDF